MTRICWCTLELSLPRTSYSAVFLAVVQYSTFDSSIHMLIIFTSMYIDTSFIYFHLQKDAITSPRTSRSIEPCGPQLRPGFTPGSRITYYPANLQQVFNAPKKKK